LRGRNVDPGLFQLAEYVGNGAYLFPLPNQESNLWSHQLDSRFLCCRNEGVSAERYQVELAALRAQWETIESNQIDTLCLEYVENLSRRASLIWNHGIVVVNTLNTLLNTCKGRHLP
jgi:hypothetical protein